MSSLRTSCIVPSSHLHLLHCQLGHHLHYGFHYFVYRWVCWNYLFLLAVWCLLEGVPLSYLSLKVFNVVNTYGHIFTCIIGWETWNEGFPLETYHCNFIVVKLVCVVVSFVSLLHWSFGLEFVAAVVCAIVLKMGSSTCAAVACLPHGYDPSNTQCI